MNLIREKLLHFPLYIYHFNSQIKKFLPFLFFTPKFYYYYLKDYLDIKLILKYINLNFSKFYKMKRVKDSFDNVSILMKEGIKANVNAVTTAVFIIFINILGYQYFWSDEIIKRKR
jgi:hypothetical protein